MNTAIARPQANTALNSPVLDTTPPPKAMPLLMRHTGTLRPVDTQGMAQEIADYAQRDPAGAKALYQEVTELLDSTGKGYAKDQLHQDLELALKQQLSPAEVTDFYLTEGLEALTTTKIGETDVGGNKLATLDPDKLVALAEEITAGSPDAIEASLAKLQGLPESNNQRALRSMIFLKTPIEVIEKNPDLQASMAQNLAELVGSASDNIEKDTAAFKEALASDAGRALLSNSGVEGGARLWAARELVNNPDFAKAALSAENSQPWEDKQVLELRAAATFQPLAARGDHSVSVDASSKDLENLIGTGLGANLGGNQRWPTHKNLPTSEAELATVNKQVLAGNYNLYEGDAVVDTIATGVRNAQTDMGGGKIGVATLPIQFSSKETGPVNLQLYRVDGEQGQQKYVDNQGRVYDNFEAWRTENKLPPGKMTFPADGSLNNGDPKLVTENTPQTSDTFWEKAGDVADVAALVGGVVASGVIILGSGGLATPVVTAAWAVSIGSAAYSGGVAASELMDRSEHGQSLALSDPDARAAWLDLGASALTMGGAGFVRAGTQLSQAGSQYAPLAARAGGAMNAGASYADAASMANHGYGVVKNWDDLSPAQRFQEGLTAAFYGGMTGVSTKASGGSLTDAFSFRAQMNSAMLTTGAGVSMNPDMGSAVRINQLDAQRGSLTIEHGPNATKESIDIHKDIARMVIDNGGLQGAVRRTLGAELTFKPGTYGEAIALEALKHERLLANTQARMEEAPPQQRGMFKDSLDALELRLHGYRDELAAIKGDAKLGDRPAHNGIMVADGILSNERRVPPNELRFTSIDDFNRAANAPLPNTKYIYGNYSWTTDDAGRVSVIEGEAALKKHGRYVTPGEPDTRKIGNDGGFEDVGFHFVGDQFDGPINGLNVVPGSGRSITLSNGEVLKNLNLSRYKTDFEHPVANLFRETGKPVPISIRAVYNDDNFTSRPDGFEANFQRPNGKWITVPFENRAGG